eukprot:3479594-Rhodomonas_salina.1
MGLEISNIGAHSFLKGTATWLAGMVDWTSRVQIYLLAGWSLGMQKQYIFEGGGSNRHVRPAATSFFQLGNVSFWVLGHQILL